MAKAKKLPSGNWRCKANYTDEAGKYITKSFTADSKKAAEFAAQAFLMERETLAKPENKTVGQLADEYIKNRENLLSASTIAGYKRIRKIAFQSIVDCRIGYLTKEMYQAAVSEYAMGRSFKTVNNAHSFYSKILKANNVNVSDDVLLPQKVKHEIEIPTDEEVVKLLKETKGTRLYLYCLFSLFAGLRKSETIALRWSDIDLENETVTISKALVKGADNVYVEKLPKTTAGTRTIHLPQIILDELKDGGDKESHIFSDTPDALDSGYKRLRSKIGFNYNFHSLRHYYASCMAENNIPDIYAQRMMGHSDPAMTRRIYQHVKRAKLTEFEKTMDDFVRKNFTIDIGE